ncbi:MAG: MFS transporter [Chloroflexota bacterium]|nr:MFS transporter [Chloroflexota bacterium]
MARRIAGGWTRPFREDTEGGIFYGWWMVGAGFLMKLVYALLVFQAFGAYVAVLREEFEWSKTLFAGAFAMSRVESGALGPLQGWMVDRFGPRRVMQIGVVIMALGFFWFSQINSPEMFVLSFFTVSLGAGLAGFMTLTIAVVKWFERRRATALGLMSTGMAVGGLLIPLLILSLDTFGWRDTALASGVIVLLIGFPISLVMRTAPEEHGHHVDGRRDLSTGQARRAPQPDFTTRQALRTRAFWFVSLGHASAVLIVSAVMVHLIVYVSEDLGYSLGFAGALVSLMTACMMVGQVGGGFVGDRVNKRLLVVGCMIGHVAGLLLLANATALWMLLVFAIAHGLSWGTRGPQMAAIRADYFGRTSFGTIMGFSSMIVMFGMMLGPIIAGAMADATGSYTAGFTLLAVMAAAGSLFFVLARPPRRPLPIGAAAARPAGAGHTEPARPAPRGGTEGAR